MYKSTVREIGPLALSFEEENIVILYGPQAPRELREVSIIHENDGGESEEPIQEGGKLVIDDQEFTINKVGSSANDNLKELGHISIYFTEPFAEVLPGAVFASPHRLPVFKEGSTIEFK
ncbi:PTS glucitol/sorbitol transporter subunit IIA [Bacillus sp. NSP9.1]|uniref:PTS glucitol/sorbitol transporter subunit IIA n=1 Tax=Bacillus sp. NSP9.1 TaxID=1071078 RepID=UPI000406CC14|nr:PTS glucitol/sorbitol transporter subunit IIA [Bacillus sp. NSP9.1]QHZ48455.1 PTS glucitol/sorbitol transporter subunit IIA [Bacillus sp. NSP9.1]